MEENEREYLIARIEAMSSHIEFLEMMLENCEKERDALKQRR